MIGEKAAELIARDHGVKLRAFATGELLGAALAWRSVLHSTTANDESGTPTLRAAASQLSWLSFSLSEPRRLDSAKSTSSPFQAKTSQQPLVRPAFASISLNLAAASRGVRWADGYRAKARPPLKFFTRPPNRHAPGGAGRWSTHVGAPSKSKAGLPGNRPEQGRRRPRPARLQKPLNGRNKDWIRTQQEGHSRLAGMCLEHRRGRCSWRPSVVLQLGWDSVTAH